jgi:hypothetical protein
MNVTPFAIRIICHRAHDTQYMALDTEQTHPSYVGTG